MSLLNNLERKLSRVAIQNLTTYLILGQVLFYVFALSGRFILSRIVLVPALVLAGEWWRLLTFLFIPPATNPVFAFFGWYLFYMMGGALEGHWGAFRYNLFLLTGYLATTLFAFLFPYSAATNIFIGGSVFLAFAYLFPDFQILIFFILPVRIKWLALITWIGYGYELLVGDWNTRMMILASASNFLLFFGRDIVMTMKTGRRAMARQARGISASKEPFHRCEVCGKTDLSHPQEEFRYCPECGGIGYCMEHITNHQHQKKQ